MMVWHVVLCHLPDVSDDLFADHIGTEGLLQQHVAAVFFVGQDSFDDRMPVPIGPYEPKTAGKTASNAEQSLLALEKLGLEVSIEDTARKKR